MLTTLARWVIVASISLGGRVLKPVMLNIKALDFFADKIFFASHKRYFLASSQKHAYTWQQGSVSPNHTCSFQSFLWASICDMFFLLLWYVETTQEEINYTSLTPWQRGWKCQWDLWCPTNKDNLRWWQDQTTGRSCTQAGDHNGEEEENADDDGGGGGQGPISWGDCIHKIGDEMTTCGMEPLHPPVPPQCIGFGVHVVTYRPPRMTITKSWSLSPWSPTSWVLSFVRVTLLMAAYDSIFST